MNAIQRQTLNGQVLSALTDAILSGELSEGMKLPAERELAASLSVSRNTLREAIRKLEIFGILESRHGMGTFVSPGARARIPNIEIIHVLSENLSAKALMDARLALEPGLAEMAAERRTDADLEALSACARVLMHSGANAAPESLFHYRIALASRSEIACRFLSMLLSQLYNTPYPSLQDRAADQYNSKEIAEHEEILACIRARDGDGARAAMQRHLKERCDLLYK